MTPKILVACPIAERAWAIPHWFEGIKNQNIDVDVLCLLSPSEDGTETLLKEREVEIIYDYQPGRKPFEIDGHCWGDIKIYQYMADLRNQLLDRASTYDFFFSLDSDIILPPGALDRLIWIASQHEGVFSPAVNMAPHSVAWNVMSWVDRDRPVNAHRPLKEPKAGRSDIVMAAMFLDRSAIESCCWAAHPQGEDVGFCLEAHRRNVKLWWVPEIRCDHMMRRR